MDVRQQTCWSAHPLEEATRCYSGDEGLALVLSEGAATIIGRTGEFVVHEGDLLISDLDVLPLLSDVRGWRARVLLLPDRRIVEHVELKQRPLILAFDGEAHVSALIKKVLLIGDDIARLSLGDEMVAATMINLITTLGCVLVGQDAGSTLSGHNKATIERARLVMESHLGSPDFGVAALSREMRLSSRQLSSLFASLGTTTAQAILQMRLDRSMRMLREPVNARRQIASIASACGFADQSYFSRCFLRHVGKTPSVYRKESSRIG